MIEKIYVGYHGTNRESAAKIMRTNEFLKSKREDEWLGEGIYFFEYAEDSHWWCKDCKKLRAYSVMKVSLNPSIIVNLVSSKNDVENFKKLCETVKNKSPRMSDGRIRNNFISLAIKLMLELKKPDMIIGAFNENRKFWFMKDAMKTKFPLVVCQIQYCVLNHECIKEISIFEEVS